MEHKHATTVTAHAEKEHFHLFLGQDVVVVDGPEVPSHDLYHIFNSSLVLDVLLANLRDVTLLEYVALVTQAVVDGFDANRQNDRNGNQRFYVTQHFFTF